MIAMMRRLHKALGDPYRLVSSVIPVTQVVEEAISLHQSWTELVLLMGYVPTAPEVMAFIWDVWTEILELIHP